MAEAHIQQQIRLELSRGPVRLWRNNTGALRDERGRMVTFGLCPGSADLIGYSQVTITPEMVGQTLPVFTAVEVKAPGGRATQEQLRFLQHLQQAGARAGIAHSVDEARAIVRGSVDATPIRCADDTDQHHEGASKPAA